jgi:hypothetical protein
MEKPATGLNILEKPLWVKLFDHAFLGICKQMEIQAPYSLGTFFRTMEDASAVDLDWFSEGWFIH